MSTKIELKTELELRPLEAHELDIVNGAFSPVQMSEGFVWGHPGGMFAGDFLLYTTAYTTVSSPVQINTIRQQEYGNTVHEAFARHH